MGLDALRKFGQAAGSQPGPKREILDLVPGNRLENWEEINNMRLEYDGAYLRLKRRGGSTSQKSFTGTILTMYPFVSRPENETKEYIAVHTTSGNVYLWNVTDDITTTILTGFSTADKIQITHNGLYLYAFDYDNGAARFYGIEEKEDYPYLNYNKGYISSINKTFEGVIDAPDLLGFEIGSKIIVFPNYSEIDDKSSVLSSASGDGQLNPSDYAVNSFWYEYVEGGKYLVDASGKEFKRDQVIGFSKNGSPLQYTIGGTGTDFSIFTLYYPLNSDGEVDYTSYVSDIMSIDDSSPGVAVIKWKDPVGIVQSVRLGAVTAADLNNSFMILPYSPDLKDLVGKPSNKTLDNDDVTPTTSGDYKTPYIYRSYVILDLMIDGSVCMLGKPRQVRLSPADILVDGVTNINITITTASEHISKRFICSTRWQPSKEKAFLPSSPLYPNSPLFISQEIDTNQSIFSDNTPDAKLIRPITEFLPLAGGIMDLFGAGEIKPTSVASFKGSLLFGGYEVNRAIPVPYTNPATATNQNIYIDITDNDVLANNIALAFQYEYSDGKRSAIVETEEFLKEGTAVETTPSVCDQIKGFISQTITNGVEYSGELTLLYDGYELAIPLSASTHATAPNTAEALRAAIQGDVLIKITASIASGAQIDYTEKRYGEIFNGEVLDFEQTVPWAIDGASYLNSKATGATSPKGVTFSPDGMKMFVVDGDTVSEWDLSSAWDQTTATDSTNSYATTAGYTTAYWDESSSPELLVTRTPLDSIVGIDFNPAGTKMFLLGAANNNMYEYTLSVGFDLSSTVTLVTTFDISSELTDPTSLVIGNEGFNMYVSGAQDVWMYELSTAYTTSTAGYTALDVLSTASGTTAITGISIKKDTGTKIFVCSISEVFEYDLSTAWEVKTGSYNSKSYDFNINTTSATDMVVYDGLYLFLLDSSTATVWRYDLPEDLGLVFDTEDPVIAGAEDPVPISSQGYIAITRNNLTFGSSSSWNITINGDFVSVTINKEDSLNTIVVKVVDAINGNATLSADWTAVISNLGFLVDGTYYPGLTISSVTTAATFNGSLFYVGPTGVNAVTFQHGAPGRIWSTEQNVTAGGNTRCLPAEAYIDVNANDLAGAATEDHTLTIEGNDTSPITILDTDTLEEIVDKYITTVAATFLIDVAWSVAKIDNGDGTWRLTLTYRQYGTVGDSKVISVAGAVDVTLDITTPSSGGNDGGGLVYEPASSVSANLLQIHSLNLLVNKIFVLGRSGATTFYVIEEISISTAKAHGEVIELPNTVEALDELEAQTAHTQPTTAGIREVITLQNYINIGTPYQEFTISGQKPLVDQSDILRVIPLDFDIDKTLMRYKFLVVTDTNLQLAYLVDVGAGFDADIEIFYEGIRIKEGSRKGITLVENDRVIMQTEDGIKLFDNGQIKKLIDEREYTQVENKTLYAAVLNRTHNEYWFHFDDSTVLVWDINEGVAKTFNYSGPSIGGKPKEAVYAHGNIAIGLGTNLAYTDIKGVHDDVEQGVNERIYINGFLISKHIGTPHVQTKILEIDIGGGVYDVTTELDLQRERLEDTGGAFDSDFVADVSIGPETATIAGKSFQFHKRAIMPKIKVDISGDGDGFISHINMAYEQYENRGKARK